MIDPSQVAMFAIFTPLAVAVSSHLLTKLPRDGAKLAKTTCVVASYITLSLVLLLISAVSDGPIQTEVFIIALPAGPTGLELYIDYLALVPALLSSLFTALALTYNVYYLSPYNRSYQVGWEFNRAYSFILLFNGAMLGTLFSNNLLGVIIFWELVSVCSYVLISFWNKDQFCLWASIKCFIMTHIGSLALLLAVILIYSATGTLRISEIGQLIPVAAPVISPILALLLIAVLPKTVLFPFHTWLPDGTVAPTSATVLFHVCGFQSGIYMIFRFFLDVFQVHVIAGPTFSLPMLFGNVSVWSFMISLVGAITLVVGALNGIIENDFKRIVAYSTISQLGYIVMAAGLTTSMGVTASLFHMISHALYCGLLFLCAGAVIFATGKHDINDLGGLYREMPITAGCSLVGILSLSTVPLFSDFASKYLIFNATINAGATVFTAIAFLGCLLNVAIAVRLLHSVFMQKTAKSFLRFSTKDPPASMLMPMVLASVLLVVFGVLPMIPLNTLVTPAVSQIGFKLDIVTQLGVIQTPLGFWDPLFVTLSMAVISTIFIVMTHYSGKRAAAFRDPASEETFKPFLCGEDLNLLDGPQGHHFYHTLTAVLEIDRACAASDPDRLFNSASAKFFNSCKRLLRLDIRQDYFTAFLSFIVGAAIVFLIAVLAG